MPVKKRRAPRKKLSTKFKQNPIQTTKSEFNKLGPIGKTMVVATIAGATSLQASRALDQLPLVGPFMQVFTSWGARIRQPRS
jgi:hypothetical protein